MKTKSKLPAVTAKQINEQHRLAIQCAETAIEHAILCGQLLVDKKASLAHGEFQEWVDQNCEFAYSTGARYMKAAQSSESVSLSALRHIFPSGKPKEKPPNRAPQISPAEEICVKTAAEKAPFSPPEAPKLEPDSGVVGPPKNGPYALVDSPAKVDSDLGWIGPRDPEDDEAAQLEQAEKDYAASIDKVMAADDKLAAAHAEIKRQAAEIATLKLSRNQYQNQCAELIRKVKSLQRALDKKHSPGNSVPYEH